MFGRRTRHTIPFVSRVSYLVSGYCFPPDPRAELLAVFRQSAESGEVPIRVIETNGGSRRQ